MHQSVIRYHFVSPSPPFALKGIGRLQHQKTPFLWEVLPFLQDLQFESAVLPLPGNRGQNVARNGGPQTRACLILLENDLQLNGRGWETFTLETQKVHQLLDRENLRRRLLECPAPPGTEACRDDCNLIPPACYCG